MKGGVGAWRKAGLPMVSRETEALTQLADLCPDCKAPAHEHSA